MNWYTYLAVCADKSIYTGVTTDIRRRETEHNTDNRKGSKSLRGKRPIQMVYYEKYGSQSEAVKREAAIKNWHKSNKLKLIINTSKLGFTL